MMTLLPPFYGTQRRESKCITANDDDSPCIMTSVQIFPVGKNHVVLSFCNHPDAFAYFPQFPFVNM